MILFFYLCFELRKVFMKDQEKFKLYKESSYWSRLVLIILGDIVGISFAYLLALWIRYDFMFTKIPSEYFFSLACFLPFIVLCSLIIYYISRLYHSIWVYASVSELIRIVQAYLLLFFVNVLLSFIPLFLVFLRELRKL